MNNSHEDLFQELCMIVDEEETETPEKITEKHHQCKHENLFTDSKNIILCLGCGIQISNQVSYEREWRWYGPLSDTKHSSDPNRTTIRKLDTKGIFTDLEKYNFNTKVVYDANQLYSTITQNKILRGKKRLGIIFACVYHSFLKNNIQISCQGLLHIFEMEQSIALRGLKFCSIHLPLESDIHSIKMKKNDIEHLITEIMQKFSATALQIEEVIELYKFLLNKSSLLNRSRPQSVASGVCKYYILNKNPDFSNEYFKCKVKLSDLTLKRIITEIETIVS